jgi:hypothetical protein
MTNDELKQLINKHNPEKVYKDKEKKFNNIKISLLDKIDYIKNASCSDFYKSSEKLNHCIQEIQELNCEISHLKNRKFVTNNEALDQLIKLNQEYQNVYFDDYHDDYYNSYNDRLRITVNYGQLYIKYFKPFGNYDFTTEYKFGDGEYKYVYDIINNQSLFIDINSFLFKNATDFIIEKLQP